MAQNTVTREQLVELVKAEAEAYRKVRQASQTGTPKAYTVARARHEFIAHKLDQTRKLAR